LIQVLVQDDAEGTRTLSHLLQRATTVTQQVDSATPSEPKSLKARRDAFGRVLDAGEGVSDVAEQVLAPAQLPL
jgi:hypothetical protein